MLAPSSTNSPRKFGKYLLLERIGRGGMAEVYRSKTFGAAGFVKECAIKKILSSLLDDDQFVRMFVDEAKLTAFLTHPNIVQVLDLGEIEGHLFIAMEYVAGKDLLDVLARSARRGVRVPIELTVYIVMEMLKGLDFAHKALDAKGEPMGIVHRDVSPSNILISYDGQVKVGDFGIAKSQMQSSKTEIGTQKGKTGYMSPEQVTGDPVDRRSDLFAAAVILFELLTMTRLFKAKSDLDVMIKIRDADIDGDLERAARLSPGLAQIIRKGLQPNPDDRFQTGEEFLDRLRDYVQDRRIKTSAGALSDYVCDLFEDKIEAEREQRATDPVDIDKFEDDSSALQTIFRYRDYEGSIHGPMSAAMLVELLESRTRNDNEAISFDGGPWRVLSSFEEFAAVGRPDQSQPPAALDDSEIGLRLHTGADWEELSLAGVNPNTRHRKRSAASGNASSESGAHKNVDGEARRFGNTLVGPGPIAPQGPEHTPKPHDQPAASLSVGEHLPSAGGAGWVATTSRRAHSRAASLTSPGPRANSITPEEFPAPTPAPQAAPNDSAHGINDLASVPLTTQHPLRTADCQGNLHDVSPFRLMHRVDLHALTGRLRLTDEQGVIKDLYFADGQLNAAESTAGTDSLIELLRTRDAITFDQADEATQIHARTGVAIGNILLQLKAVAPHELFHFLQEQLAEKALTSVFWDRGTWQWFSGEQTERDAFSATVGVSDLLARAITERARNSYFRRFYKAQRRTRLTQRLHGDALTTLRLSARAMRIISSLDTVPNIADIVRVFADRYNWSEAEVYRTVYTLTEYEVLRFEGETPLSLPGATA